MEPKFIKGPDIFLKAVERLRREIPVVVLLTGPARGFVKQGLDRIGVPFFHRYVRSHAELVECYHALDLYFVTSREEGGPMGLMEGMASGVPVVSTAVGMAPDLIVDGMTGALVEGESAEDITEKALRMLSLPESESARLKEQAAKAVKICDWSVVGRRHLDEVYKPLLRHAS
jgi:glycosyltransferase involved in cell wall biosynthesis